jgi:hypothetical protein
MTASPKSRQRWPTGARVAVGTLMIRRAHGGSSRWLVETVAFRWWTTIQRGRGVAGQSVTSIHIHNDHIRCRI